MRKTISRDTVKAKLEHAIDTLAPGAAEQMAGEAKAKIGQGQARLGELTGHPEMAAAGHKLETEGKAEVIVGRVKAATTGAAEQIKAATAEAVEHVKTAGERISEKLKGQPEES